MAGNEPHSCGDVFGPVGEPCAGQWGSTAALCSLRGWSTQLLGEVANLFSTRKPKTRGWASPLSLKNKQWVKRGWRIVEMLLFL